MAYTSRIPARRERVTNAIEKQNEHSAAWARSESVVIIPEADKVNRGNQFISDDYSDAGYGHLFDSDGYPVPAEDFVDFESVGCSTLELLERVGLTPENLFADLANAIPTGEPDIERIKIVGERDGVKFVFRQQEGL